MRRTRILVLHGPSLNLLGEREPAVYGATTLPQLDAMLRAEARRLGASLRVHQRNGEGQLIDLIHRHRRWFDGLLINPGAYTHYSWALRDAVAAVSKPCVEVHLSDVDARAAEEPFRAVSVLEGIRAARFAGRGPRSYLEGLRRLVRRRTMREGMDMRISGAPVAAASLLALCGCLYTDVRVPRAYRSATPADVKAAADDPAASGRACNRTLLYLVAWGDAGYAAAVKDALKDRPDAVLYDVKSDAKVSSYLFGLFARSCTVVSGRAGRP